MLRKGVLVSLIVLLALTAEGQNKAVQFGELAILQARDARPVVVLITTGWCKYCHAMKNTMLANKKVAMTLNTKFRTVFLDAEEKQEIVFAGRIFKYKQGINELARALGTVNGQVSYPTLCILNSKNEIIYQYDGYLPPAAILDILEKIDR